VIRAALFDIDGTLIDTVDLHAAAWKQAFEHFGKELPYGEIRAQIGKGGDKLIPSLLSPEEDERFGPDLEEYRSGLYLREFLPLAEAFPGARALVERVRQAGLLLALASSCKKAELEHDLRVIGIEGAVDAAVTGDDIEGSKPDPDVFEAALDRLGVAPRDALAIGDSPYDAIAAARAGVRTIGLLCGGFSREALLEAGCIEIYDSPADLLARFDASALSPAAGGELTASP
jgi:HAD superfamily hydrolase (TIGR01509 family)